MASKVAKSGFKSKKRGPGAFGFDARKPGRPKKNKPVEAPEETPVTVTAASLYDTSPPPPPNDTYEEPQNIYAALTAAAEAEVADADVVDPVALMNLAISADLDPSVFTEQSFPVAANVIDWCRSADFLGFTGELWPKQIEILSRFFSDVCYFCSDTDYVHNVPVSDSLGNVLDRFVFLQHGICPKCQRNRTEMLDDWRHDSRYGKYNEFEPHIEPRPVPPNEFVGVWGQRAGKSFTSATFAIPYILHRYLALPNPPRYFNRPKNVVFEGSFVAPTIHQVTENIWMPFREVYESSPWFKAVKQNMISEGKRLGVQMYHAAQTFIVFPGKRISLHIQAANTANLRGATRIFATLDELGWFNHTPDGKRRSNVKDGSEIFNSLSNSLVTVRTQANRRRQKLNDYDALDAYMFNISSPSSAHDPIMQRMAVATQSPRMYATHYATWDVNPDEDKATIKEQKAGDPESFKRDFCAMPPRALSPFFPDQDMVRQLVDTDAGEALFRYAVNEVRDEGMALLRPAIKDIRFDLMGGRILTIDNGEVNNSFALCIARYDVDTDATIYEEFLEVAPYQGFHVDLAWCYNELIVPLVKTFQFVNVVFDRWNSAHQVLDLRTTHQTNADRYTLKWGDFDAFREAMLGMRVRFPAPEKDPDDVMMERAVAMRSQWPRAHFQLQLSTVEQFGRKLFKPENGSDDLFRVGALAHAYIRRNKDEYIRQASRRRRGGVGSVGAFRGASNREGGAGRGAGPRRMGETGRASGAFYNQ